MRHKLEVGSLKREAESTRKSTTPCSAESSEESPSPARVREVKADYKNVQPTLQPVSPLTELQQEENQFPFASVFTFS